MPEVEQSPRGRDASLPPISLVNQNLMEGFGHVDFAEDVGATDVIGKVFDVW